jgi:hypothetical protein
MTTLPFLGRRNALFGQAFARDEVPEQKFDRERAAKSVFE